MPGRAHQVPPTLNHEPGGDPRAAPVHAEVFGTARPATTALVAAAFLDPRWKVEFEAEAVVG